MRIAVTGSRRYTDKAIIAKAIDGFRTATIIHGGATGADQLADDIARALNMDVLVFKADWGRHGKAAGPIRNQQMIDEGQPDLVLAFPLEDSRGTWDMVARARKAGIEVRIF